MKLHFQVAGNGAPIVITPGLGDTAESWTSIWMALQAKGRALVWDLRGHGKSESPDQAEHYRPELACADMVQMIGLADGNAGNPAVLIGHSLGGYLSMRVTLQNPDLVRAIVLVATGPGFRDEAMREKWNMSLDSFTLGRQTHSLARHLAKHNDATVIEGLASIRVPTLIIVGGNDHPFAGAKDYLVKRIPNSFAVVIPEGGHSIHRSHPMDVADAIQSFLECHAPWIQ
jgi:pimeloyl-ACP methyl ester carboxylesterase